MTHSNFSGMESQQSLIRLPHFQKTSVLILVILTTTLTANAALSVKLDQPKPPAARPLFRSPSRTPSPKRSKAPAQLFSSSAKRIKSSDNEPPGSSAANPTGHPSNRRPPPPTISSSTPTTCHHHPGHLQPHHSRKRQIRRPEERR